MVLQADQARRKFHIASLSERLCVLIVCEVGHRARLRCCCEVQLLLGLPPKELMDFDFGVLNGQLRLVAMVHERRTGG
eukprot:CAMPEP_0170455236 /NCGR_PEP_ID=MMETSP0123-20130129/3259_1 /TAXON_ID=182087 /ORGANISM="Favella ehrenbergii, Strain Fehren 1" /LENGTH=77 /DNA_ID=CAMNT_0010718289 /DNA_START=969 /DNA_END=1202 /DNA_ORIENTATION=+